MVQLINFLEVDIEIVKSFDRRILLRTAQIVISWSALDKSIETVFVRINVT